MSQKETITITARDRIIWYLVLPASVGIASYLFNSFRYGEWPHWMEVFPPAIGTFIGAFIIAMAFPQLISRERQERYKNLSMQQKIFRNSLFLLLVG